jgi:hypothetical protein
LLVLGERGDGGELADGDEGVVLLAFEAEDAGEGGEGVLGVVELQLEATVVVVGDFLDEGAVASAEGAAEGGGSEVGFVAETLGVVLRDEIAIGGEGGVGGLRGLDRLRSNGGDELDEGGDRGACQEAEATQNLGRVHGGGGGFDDAGGEFGRRGAAEVVDLGSGAGGKGGDAVTLKQIEASISEAAEQTCEGIDSTVLAEIIVEASKLLHAVGDDFTTAPRQDTLANHIREGLYPAE